MTAATRALYSFGIRPHFRWREFRLLVLVAITLAVGWTSLESFRNGELELGEASLLVIYLAFVFAIHLAFVITGRRMDQVLFPTAALLGGISLLLMQRLPQDLVVQSVAGRDLGLAPLQLVWLIAGFLILAALAIFVRSDGWLRRYKYTWAAVGIGLLLLVFLFGEVTGGARLTLRIGPLSGQPSELLKVILVVFLAGYLAENRALLAESSTRVGPFNLPPLPYLLPMIAMWGIALAIVIVQRDLGAALLYFLVFLALLYVATRRASYVVFGLLLFIAGGALLYLLFPHVQERIDIWIDPVRRSTGGGLPDHPGPLRLRSWRHHRHGARCRVTAGRNHSVHPGDPHRLRLRRAGRGDRHARRTRRAGPVRTYRSARLPHCGHSRGRLPCPARNRADAGDRGPGGDHRRRQPARGAAHRNHSAFDQLRRLVHPCQRRGDRSAACTE